MHWLGGYAGVVLGAVGLIAAPAAAGPPHEASSPQGILQAVHIDRGPSNVTIRLVASVDISGTLHALEAPRRLFLDLPGVVPHVPRQFQVDRAGVQQLRIALNRARPAVTRLVLDLTSAGSYRLERGATRRELRVHIAASPPTSGRTASYVAWFETTASRLNQLLGRSAAASTPDNLTQLQREWSGIPGEVTVTPPSSGYESEHDLLLAAVRLGQVAIARRVDASRLTAEAEAGEAGATMLVARARAQLATATARMGPRLPER